MKKIFSLLSITVLILSGCQRKALENKEVVAISVYHPFYKVLKEKLYFLGDIKGQDQVYLYPKVDGKLLEKKVEESGWVKKGDVICLIERDITGYDYQPAQVTSPIDGWVAKFFPDIGESLSPKTPVALISDFRWVEIELNVPQKLSAHIKKGTKAIVYVDAYPDRKFEGQISEVSSFLDEASRTLSCKVTVNNKDLLLKPGMYAEVSLILQEKKCLVIHRDSLIFENQLPYVYVVEEGKAKKRHLKLGIEDGLYFEVIEGLTSRDLVVFMGKELLREARAVKVARYEDL
jgi:multidrug efflux pump subunit AcrA (membrane-fusion protein)